MELAYIFLGYTPPRGIKFKVPGAMHHARFMAKGIYSLKIFLFRNEFHLDDKDIAALRDVCIFILKFYIKSWYTASVGITAPNNDFQLLKNLIDFEKSNKNMAKAAQCKLLKHLWYMSEELIGLALFDDAVSCDVKERMARAMMERPSLGCYAKRLTLKEKDCKSLGSKDLSDFASQKSITLFTQFQLSHEFFDFHSEEWPKQESYVAALKVFKDLKVVNDVAERGVALMEEFNRRFTKSEDQMQYSLQVVQDHRMKFPNCSKTKLSSVT